MDAIKVELPRAVALGYWLFLESEAARHLGDIRMIRDRQAEIRRKYKISIPEIETLEIRAEDFVEIE